MRVINFPILLQPKQNPTIYAMLGFGLDACKQNWVHLTLNPTYQESDRNVP